MTSFRPPTPVSLLDITSIRQPCRSAYLRVHAEQLGGKQRRFVAAGAGADFEHDVLLVVGILRDQQHLELGDERVAARDERLQLFLRELAHVGVAGRSSSSVCATSLHDRLVLAKPLDGRLDLGQRLGVLAVFGRIALQLGRAEPLHQLVVLPLDGRQFIKHDSNLSRDRDVACSRG